MGDKIQASLYIWYNSLYKISPISKLNITYLPTQTAQYTVAQYQ